jgi:aspartyl-tRNA(Asn)/glutamyl-tRNA(Gln) amidotransferase subunit B
MLQRALRVGLEIHAQLRAKHKLFSPAKVMFNAPPNSCVHPFDIALPGTLPRINKQCVALAVRAGIALQGRINRKSMFSRKHYFYCDLPLGYQITQQEFPIVSGGVLEGVKIQRIQLEQDSGKSLHDIDPEVTYIDLNRAGAGLLEIVTEPDVNSPEHACRFISRLQKLLQHIDVCDGIMAEGSLRVDVNVSLHDRKADGSLGPGERVEIKNLNSLKAVSKSIMHEIERQNRMLNDGIKIERETRTWDVKNGITVRLRSKEELLDYRFILDPDLPPLYINDDFIDNIRQEMPPLPEVIAQSLKESYGLSDFEVSVLIEDPAYVEYYKNAVNELESSGVDLSNFPDYKKVVWNWIANELFGRLRSSSMEEHMDGIIRIRESPVSAKQIGILISLVLKGEVSGKAAKQVIEHIIKSKDQRGIQDIVDHLDLRQISNYEVLFEASALVVNNHPAEVEKYLNGNLRPLNYLVSQVLKSFNGKANPAMVKECVLKLVLAKKNNT